MIKRFIELNSDRMNSWDAFVKNHRFGTIYHTSAWRSVIERVYGHTPLYYALEDETGVIYAGLPVFLVRSKLTGTRLSTLPCAQSCNPLVEDERDYRLLKIEIMDRMVGFNAKMWEVKTTASFEFEKPYSDSHDEGFVTHLLRIDRPETDIFNSFHKSSIQRAIVRAQKSGLVIRPCSSKEEVGPFIELYTRMRREKGLLPQPGCFFLALWDILGRENMIDLLYADYRGRPVSAVMLLKYKDTVVYEYGATEEGYHRLSPSPLLLWEAILMASGQGYRSFDFGRTATAEKGLLQFKNRWGTRQERLPYYEMTGNAGIGMMRKSGRMKMLMALAMRVMPESMCSTAANLLYRHLV